MSALKKGDKVRVLGGAWKESQGDTEVVGEVIGDDWDGQPDRVMVSIETSPTTKPDGTINSVWSDWMESIPTNKLEKLP